MARFLNAVPAMLAGADVGDFDDTSDDSSDDGGYGRGLVIVGAQLDSDTQTESVVRSALGLEDDAPTPPRSPLSFNGFRGDFSDTLSAIPIHNSLQRGADDAARPAARRSDVGAPVAVDPDLPRLRNAVSVLMVSLEKKEQQYDGLHAEHSRCAAELQGLADELHRERCGV
jgi:hypothetical protein